MNLRLILRRRSLIFRLIPRRIPAKLGRNPPRPERQTPVGRAFLVQHRFLRRRTGGLALIAVVLCLVVSLAGGQTSAASFLAQLSGGSTGPASSCLPGETIATATPPPPGTPSTGVPCALSASPPEAFNPLGASHTVTFVCGAAVNLLPGPTGAGYPPGCYDVVASLSDSSNGSDASFDSATCGIANVGGGSTVNCAAQNPLCPAGTVSQGGSCVPNCPAGFQNVGPRCLGYTTTVCPPGSTPEYNNPGLIQDCVSPADTTAVPSNEMTVTFNSGSPHAFLVTFSGYIGTTAAGTCPDGTVYTPSVTLVSASATSPAVVGPACAFSVIAQKKFVEVNRLSVQLLGTPCGGGTTLNTGMSGLGHPCYFTVTAFGTVVLTTNVDCSGPNIPPTGSSATSAGFPAGSTYVCENGVLSVQNIVVPFVPITVTATGGYLQPTCYPAYLFSTTPGPTPLPSATAPPVTPGTPEPPVCGAPGQTTITTTTDNGQEPPSAGTVTYEGGVVSGAAPPGGTEGVTATFTQNGQPIAGVEMFAEAMFPDQTVTCVGKTAAGGSAACDFTVPAGETVGSEVPVYVYLIDQCSQYVTSDYFTVGSIFVPLHNPPAPGPGPFQAPAPVGICAAPNGFGPVYVTATMNSTSNTQPPVSSGPVELGAPALSTPVPTPGSPVPTATPAPSPTPSPTATVTPTPSPTATPTATATPSATATSSPPTAPNIRFHVVAARVQKSSVGNEKGVDSIYRGEKVYLLDYFAVSELPKSVKGTDKYSVLSGGHTIFSVTYRNSLTKKDLGHTSARYAIFQVPGTAGYGNYTFTVAMHYGKVTSSKSWHFAIVRRSFRGS